MIPQRVDAEMADLLWEFCDLKTQHKRQYETGERVRTQGMVRTFVPARCWFCKRITSWRLEPA